MFLGLASIIYIVQDFNVGPSSDLKAYAELFIFIPAVAWMYIWLGIRKRALKEKIIAGKVFIIYFINRSGVIVFETVLSLKKIKRKKSYYQYDKTYKYRSDIHVEL